MKVPIFLTLFLTLLAVVLLGGCTSDTKISSSPFEENDSLSKEKMSFDENIALLEEAYKTAKKEWSASPNDQEKRKKYVEATVAYANKMMIGPGNPKVKYPKALQLYEEALAIDSSHKEAKANRDLILSIYRQMGRKPPKTKS